MLRGAQAPFVGVAVSVGAWSELPYTGLNCPTLAGALRVDSRRSARLVKGAARVWVCLWLGAALSGSAQHRTAQVGACVHCSGERLAGVHWLWRRASCCAGLARSWAGGQGWARLAQERNKSSGRSHESYG